MRRFQFIMTYVMLFSINIACKKDKKPTECWPNEVTVRQILSRPATIRLNATLNPVWIIEQGTIDTRLIPCNLPMEFYQNGLNVLISGEVKATIENGFEPCCREHFVITKIERL